MDLKTWSSADLVPMLPPTQDLPLELLLRPHQPTPMTLGTPASV